MMQALFIFDFDLTITSQHIHNLVVVGHRSGQINLADEQSIWEYVKTTPPSMHEQKWKTLLETLIDAGHYVGIATFNEFKFLVERYLKEAVGLSTEYLEKIYIEAWLPENPMLADKNRHIAAILSHFKFPVEPERIILIDDSDYNCLAARKYAKNTITATKGQLHAKELEEIYALSTKFASE